MKRIIPIVVVLIVLVSAFVWYYQSNNKPNPSLELKTETDMPMKVESSILLYPESGEVSFKSSPNAEFQKVTASPTIIPNQAIVHTDIGKASVLLPDNSSISLENNTEITVNYSPQSTSIYQSLGATYHRVEKLLSGSTYQVQTAGTLAAVRGTKFAVKYDIKTKKTKIAVTENKVEVATIPKAVGTTTPPKVESMLVEAGKTISVETLAVISPQKPSAMQVLDTKNDVEMRNYVDEQKKVDIQLENIKKESSDEKEFRKEMKRKLFNDVSEDNSSLPDLEDKKNINEVGDINNKTEEKVASDEIPKRVVEEAPVIKNDEVTKPDVVTTTPTAEDIPIITKVGEEEFFNAFEPLFIKHFYLDEVDAPCDVKVTPEERVRIVTSFAKSKGYPFTKTTLLSFAQAINEYCMNKDKDVKSKLQSRFDDEYPF